MSDTSEGAVATALNRRTGDSVLMIMSAPDRSAAVDGGQRMTSARSSRLRIAVTSVIGAALCTGVALVHVGDQGGLTAFAEPDWIGWGYRLVELGGVALAVLLVSQRATVLTWFGALLIGLGPGIGYLLSRTSGLPGDDDDIGNWSETLGAVSLVIEGALVVLALVVLLHVLSRRSAADHGARGFVAA